MIPEKVEGEIEASLKRLGVDVIDLLQIHWPTPDDQLEATWEQMLKARDAGKVRFLGVCNCDRGQLERLAKLERPASNQPPFNLLQQQILEETAPWCAEHEVGLIPYSPLLSGLLSGAFTRERAEALADDDWRRNLPIVKGAELEKLLALTDRLSSLARERGTTLANLAIAWTLTFDAITGPIVGARSPEQIQETAKAADVEIDAELSAAINEALDTYGTRTLKLY
jgi:aryl-alcohol dehydrogenase-like predicted oxidoreductase